MIEDLEEWAQKCKRCKYLKVDKQDQDTWYCKYKGPKDCNFTPYKKPQKKPQIINENIVAIPVKWQR